MKELKDKLNKEIKHHAKLVEENGASILSTSDHYNWDKDIWNHRHAIIEKLKDKGYNVSTKINWEVLDITITKELGL